MFILKNKKGLSLFGKVENKNVIPMFVEETNKIYMVSVTINNGLLVGISVIKEISSVNDKILFETTLNMVNLHLNRNRNNKVNKADYNY